MKGLRYVFTLLGFLGFCVIYALRVNLNVAIVAMVNATAVYKESVSSTECPDGDEDILSLANTTTINIEDGEFVWSTKIQAFILGSFYYGYCISQIPGGRLAEVYSAKVVFGVGIFITSLLTLLTPLVARFSVILLGTIRILEGLAQGVTMPAMHSMLGRWIPESEKGLLSTIVYTGINVGTVATMSASGVLCNGDFLDGWPSVFYIFGLVGCLWFIFWMIFVSDSPNNHPWITRSELKYITENQTIQHLKELPPLPWKKILQSVPFWALVISQFGQDWCFYTILTYLPTYLDTILHFKIEQNGLYSALPYIGQSVVAYFVGLITDFYIRRGCCSVRFVRKFCNTMSCLGSAFGLLGVCLAGCDVGWSIAMFTTSVAIGGFCYCGYLLSLLDMSPEYAGTLIGIANTISNLTGFVAPAIVGALTEEYQTLKQWRIVFYIAISIISMSGLVFIAFVPTEKQDWLPYAEEKMNLNGEAVNGKHYGSFNESVVDIASNDTDKNGIKN